MPNALDIQKSTIKGVTVPVLVGLLCSTITITAAVAGVYYNLRAEMQQDRTDSRIRQEKVDGKFERIELSGELYREDLNKRLTAVEQKVQ